MSPHPTPQAAADACLRAALVAGAAQPRAHGLVALILALILRLFVGTDAAWDLSPEDADEYEDDYAPWRYAEGRHALILPPMGRAPHAACIEAGLVPDWILPGIRNRGMRPAATPARPRPRTRPVRAPPVPHHPRGKSPPA